MLTRRTLIQTGAATGAIAILPFAARGAAHAANTFQTEGGQIVIHPVSHASFVMEAPEGVIYNDPVGGAGLYADFPAPDLVLVTHEHGDHYDADTLAGIVGEETKLLVNPRVGEMLSDELKAKATIIGNGDEVEMIGVPIAAIPAYNLTEERLKYHPKGRDNGYVLTIDGLRIYIAGDTEDIPEMRALTDIHIAFVPMNLPYTMEVEKAADAVAAFKPTYCYPYHYRDSDPELFARLVAESGAEVEVKQGAWYAA